MIGLFTEHQKKDKDQGTNNELIPDDRTENLLEFYFQSSLFFGTMPLLIPTIISITEENMQTGKVKFYNKSKRYGFIAGDDGVDYFFHESGLTEGIYVQDGDKVEFKVVEGDRGQKAVEISIID
mgnify:CR=1 FL=1